MILVDTSVWIDHIHRRVPQLAQALVDGEVVSHAIVIGELACGNIQARRQILALMQQLPSVPLVSHEEALELIERRRLMGKGLSYADVQLLASVAITHGARLWTNDKQLAAVAVALKVGFTPGS